MPNIPLDIGVQFIKNLNDTIKLSDNYSRTWTLSRTYQDILNLIDLINKQSQRLLSDDLILSDIKELSTIKKLSDNY